MKKFTSLCLTYAITMQAAIANHPTTIDCAPYAAEVRAAEQTARNFDNTLQELRQRFDNAETEIMTRQSQLDDASHAIASAEARIGEINAEIARLRTSLRDEQRALTDLLNRRAELEANIAQTRADLRNLPTTVVVTPPPARGGRVVVTPRPRGGRVVVTPRPRGGRVVVAPRPARPAPRGGRVVVAPPAQRGSNARDVLNQRLAELNQQLAQVNSRVASLENRMVPSNQRIAHLQVEKNNAQASLQQASQSLVDLQNARPTMEALRGRVVNISERLNTQDQIQAGNLAVLEQVKEKLLMCKTYTVKYPTALEQAAEISRVGCHNYQLPQVRRPFVQDAMNEIYQAICNR